MEIDTAEAIKVTIFVFTILALVIVLNVFFPNDFALFDSDLLLSPIRFDIITIGLWVTVLGVAGAIGFFTSGNAFEVAVVSIVLGLCALFYPIFAYIGNVLTLGMFTYPNMDMHKEVPLLFLLLIAIPMSIGICYLIFDLVTSALHSASGD